MYDFGVESSTGRIFLVMQLLYGRTLADLIAAREPRDPWPVSWAAATAGQCLDRRIGQIRQRFPDGERQTSIG